MSDANQKIRVFVGSPGDVAEERDAVSDVVERLNGELDRDGVGLYFQTVRWEKYAFLRDTRFTPQAAIANGIPRPRDCDVAVFIFWRRIGTVLDMTGLEPNGAGERPTGSTWEFYDALESDKTTVLTYRKRAPAPAVRDESSAQFEERQRQEREVHQFFESLRDSEGGFKRSWHIFENIAEFKADLREQLEIIAKQASSNAEALPDLDIESINIIDQPAQPEKPAAESTTKAPESDRSTATTPEKSVKPPGTHWPRWSIIGAAVVLIGVIGWYAIGPVSSPPPESVSSPKPEVTVPPSKPEQTVPSPKPEATEFPKPNLIPIPERDFSISRHEITFEQYDHYAKETGTDLPGDRGWGRGDRPVINVNLDEAKAYSDWLSDKLDQKCRLPSEAEWEYAARAGGSGDYGLGEGDVEITQDNLGDYAWYSDNAEGKTHPVGKKKKPNAWGLYDMLGNVWEWTRDFYDSDKDSYVVRGGSWYNDPVYLRAANRFRAHPFLRYDNFGFRVVCVPHS